MTRADIAFYAAIASLGLTLLCLLAVLMLSSRGTRPRGKVGDIPPRPTPMQTGLIPGRPGEEVDSGGGTFPPLRPDTAREIDRFPRGRPGDETG